MNQYRMLCHRTLGSVLKFLQALLLLTCRRRVLSLHKRRVVWISFPLLVLSFAQGAGAATISWNGVLRAVLADTETGIYTGGTEDVSVFSGSFNYGDTCGGCLVEPFPPDEINYVFSGGTGSITGLGVTTTGVESSVAISNDQVVDTDAAALFAIFGLTVTPGTTPDVWSVASETSGDVIEWDVSFVYLTTDPFSDSSYTATPPPNPDLIIFQLDEDDEVKYFAFGEVTTVVPIPASVWLFGSGLLGLIGMARRKKA